MRPWGGAGSPPQPRAVGRGISNDLRRRDAGWIRRSLKGSDKAGMKRSDSPIPNLKVSKKFDIIYMKGEGNKSPSNKRKKEKEIENHDKA